MTRRQRGAGIDGRIAARAEWVTRRIDRRTALRSAVLTGATTLGAMALGQRPAFATITCPDSCGPSPLCVDQGKVCPSYGCPSGYSHCKKPSVCGDRLCNWSSGQWVHCQGYGTCGYGYTVCQDCKPSGSCNVCICISGCLCCNCCSPSDVVAEQQRLQELEAATA